EHLLERVNDPHVSGALLAALSEQFNAIDAEYVKARQAMEGKRSALEVARRARVLAKSSIAAEELMRLVASLRNPRGREYRRLWLRSLCDMEYTVTRKVIQSSRGWIIDVSGALVVGAGDQQV